MTDSLLSIFCRVAIGAVFAWSCGQKIRAPSAFQRSVAAFNIVPPRLVPTVATFVIATEGLVVLGIAAGGRWSLLGLACSIALLTAFSLVIGRSLYRGNTIACGCFGPSNEAVVASDLVRNGFFGCCAIAGVIASTFGQGVATVPLELGIASGIAAVIFALLTTQLHAVVRFLRVS